MHVYVCRRRDANATPWRRRGKNKHAKVLGLAATVHDYFDFHEIFVNVPAATLSARNVCGMLAEGPSGTYGIYAAYPR